MSPLGDLEEQFPGFSSLTQEQKYRVIFNCFSLKEISREQGVKACMLLAQSGGKEE